MNISNLKTARKKSNLTQPQVAEILGITPVAYQNYEYGKREPNGDTIVKLADLFGVTTDYLLGRETGEPEAIEKLEREFNMTALEKKILEEYLDLPENMRDDLMEFLQKSVREVMDESD